MLLISRSRSGYSVGRRNFGDGEKQERWLTGGKRMRQVRNRSREIYGTKKRRYKNLFYTLICILANQVRQPQLAIRYIHENSSFLVRTDRWNIYTLLQQTYTQETKGIEVSVTGNFQAIAGLIIFLQGIRLLGHYFLVKLRQENDCRGIKTLCIADKIIITERIVKITVCIY